MESCPRAWHSYGNGPNQGEKNTESMGSLFATLKDEVGVEAGGGSSRFHAYWQNLKKQKTGRQSNLKVFTFLFLCMREKWLRKVRLPA